MCYMKGILCINTTSYKEPHMEVLHFTNLLYGSVKISLFSYSHIYILFVLLFLSLDQWLLMSAEDIFCPLLS
jgi:hypothetical protein